MVKKWKKGKRKKDIVRGSIPADEKDSIKHERKEAVDMAPVFVLFPVTPISEDECCKAIGQKSQMFRENRKQRNSQKNG